MPVNYFVDKATEPQNKELEIALGSTFPLFEEIFRYLVDTHRDVRLEWKQYSKKMGWQLKLLKGKRNIMFVVPFDGYFIVAFIFGDKAAGQVMESDLPEAIKTGLRDAKKYMEGRVINITIMQDTKNVDDIMKLIEIKLNN